MNDSDNKEYQPDALALFKQMQEEEERARRQRREEEGAPESTNAEQPYQYYHLDRFDNTVQISKSVEKQVDAVRRQDGVPRIRLQRRYRTLPDGQDEILGIANADGSFNYWHVTMYFDSDGITDVYCNSWRCRNRCGLREKGRIILCEHAALVYDALKEELSRDKLSDVTNYAARNLLSGIISIPDPISDSVGKEHENPITLRPLVQLSEYDGRDSLQFRVGETKLYKVKDLSQLVEDFAGENLAQFGKNAFFKLSSKLLDEEGRKWLEYIRGLDSDARANLEQIRDYNEAAWRRNSVPESLFRLGGDVSLVGPRLDRFAEFAIGSDVEFQIVDEDRSKTKKSLHVEDGVYRPRLTLMPYKDKQGEFVGVTLDGRIPHMRLGQEYAYYIDDSSFKRIPIKNNSVLRQVLETQDVGGQIHMLIGRHHLQMFYRDALPRLEQELDITEVDSELPRSYLYPEPEFTTYLDVEGPMLVGRGEVRYGSHTENAADMIEQVHKIAQEQGIDEYSVMQSFTPDFAEYRDQDAEDRYLYMMLRFVGSYDPSAQVFVGEKNDENLFHLLEDGIPEMQRMGEVRTTERFRRLRVRRIPKFTLGVSVSQDSLLDLTIKSEDLTMEEVTEILAGYRKGRKFIKLENGDFFKYDEDDALAQLRELMDTMQVSAKEFVSGKMHLPMYRALYLDKMMEDNADLYADRDRRFKSLVKEFKTVEDSDYEVPTGLRGKLRKYQLTGYRWLRTLDHYGFGGILADEMGLGKTLQVITMLLGVKETEFGETDGGNDAANDGGAGEASLAGAGDGGNGGVAVAGKEPSLHWPSLIVCPASLVYNWGEEFARFAPTLRVQLVAGTQGQRAKIIEKYSEADVLVTSYDLLKRDIDQYEGKTFRVEVIDEAQYIKNANTAQAKAVKVIQAKTKFALTGTPIENRLSELWSIFDYLMPGFLYGYEDFRSDFEMPIVKYGDEGASGRLSRMISSFVLRRRKKDVLKDLPDKIEEPRYAVMDKKQRKLYDAQAMKLVQQLRAQSGEEFVKNRIQVLAEITKLRQLCCDPSLAFDGYDGGSAKRESCLELLEALADGGHKTLLFSQFVSMLELLETELQRRDIAYYKITGATPKEKRIELVNAFNGDNTPVFLISLKAGGTGLNLTGADVVVHYDPWWNVAVENQATDRAHRIGQKNVVTVYKLIMKDTIEEKIVRMQADKQRLAEEVLGGESMSSGAISREDLLAILE